MKGKFDNILSKGLDPMRLFTFYGYEIQIMPKLLNLFESEAIKMFGLVRP